MRVVMMIMVMMMVMTKGEEQLKDHHHQEEVEEEQRKVEEQQDVEEEVEEESVGVEDDSRQTTSKEGQFQYELLRREAQMPSYGSCYQAALKDLQEGCARLNDQVQSRLALSFTNCYLARFGWPTYPCGPAEPLSTCMAHLDARSASLYSSLLTSTLAMCHFLEAQTWRKATAHAVHSLKKTSYQVTSQLDIALTSAAALRKQMDEQLTESRQALTSAFMEIRESTEEQRNLVESVFTKVGQLHSFVMGEFSGINAVVFYVVGVMVTVVVTCGTRTGSARLPLLLLITVSFAIERLVTFLVLNYLQPASPQESIEIAVQVVRRLAATFGLLMVVASAISFRDPLAAATARLEELLTSTKEIKTLFGLGGKTREEQITLASLPELYDHSDTSDDTYNPNEDSDMEECLALINCPPPPCNERIQYSLRRRKPSTPNPIVTFESPSVFSLLVNRQESLRRRKALYFRNSDVVGVSEIQEEDERVQR